MGSALVPVVGAGGWTGTPAAKAGVAEAVDRACRDVGFLMLTGHGVPGEVVSGLWAAAEEFFALPLAEKCRCIPPAADVFRDGNHDALVECLPTCTTAERPPRYPPVLAGENLIARLLGPRTGTDNGVGVADAVRLPGGVRPGSGR